MGTRERFDNLDGLRAISCLCIIAMHIRANTEYDISGWMYDTFISSWTLLVFLFLMISGFGMFCGYYERFKDGSIGLNSFYAKRYKKLLPFFGLLILIDIVLERSPDHLIEGITEATLVFGLLPNNELSVIGVGWTLGVIFLFYMLFPFFVFLCWNRKRAWLALVVSVVLNAFCDAYFFTDKFVLPSFAPRHNFLYCAPFFIAGAVIYLYREEIKKIVGRFQWAFLLTAIAVTALYYIALNSKTAQGNAGVWMLLLFSPWLIYAGGAKSRLLNNKVMHYLGGISMELYLAQMVIFRGIEKLKCLYLFGDGWISFLSVWVAVVAGLIVFTEIYKYIRGLILSRFQKAKPDSGHPQIENKAKR